MTSTESTDSTGATATEDLDALARRVEAWIADDPDAFSRNELTALLATARSGEEHVGDAAVEDLRDRFAGSLQFGTAGLRGAMQAGPNRMNRAVILRAAAGLAAYLVGSLGDEAGAEGGHKHGLLHRHEAAPARPKIVVGYDARHNSHTYALDSAAVFTAAGLDVVLLPSALPTPVLAFAVRHLDADAGVMVTASHNPPADNGYKVYLGGRAVTGSGQGAQIVPPFDALIAAKIAAAPAAAQVPRAEDGWSIAGPDVLEAYLASVGRLAVDEAPRDLKIVVTPLHGVGGAVVESVLRGAGYHDVFLVPEQAEPDPAFPTVAFPNPEEPGAIDLSLAYAQTLGADLVIANDPDADRCAVAVKDHRAVLDHAKNSGGDTGPQEGWRMLHGDEVGALLGELVASSATSGLLASSIVSSRLLGRIATAHGLDHASTLTGFKWISRVDGLVFGYEEALGYCVDPAQVRDKDGISAALRMVQLADTLKAQGRTLVDALDDLARAHGLHLTDQLSARFTDLAQIPATMQRLRTAPPASLAGSAVVETVDLSDGVDGLPPTDGLRLLAEDGSRVIVRPSGTEPKVKCYLEVIVPVAGDASVDEVSEARQVASARLQAIRADMSAALGIAPA
ncbi:phosphomannomutase [Sanguibacter keddieii DSM 10542]|uniref:Phosphomannomutase n=1 Tax=Sanguibacter keddieii (strain ATCC 51767 / DSM 10542 / NCFB 3025 / ST-74) TaxID=446469 RepID=D1BK54_SANKS|nr:phospho-sugar mutase [Sanguibacter keddieii]ACZ22463.1 phosphomannomutase [Sanguibacter keddieii DSM 10542]